MALTDRQENDIAAFYRATGELPPGISLTDPAFMAALNRVGGRSGRATNLNPAGGLDPGIKSDFLTGFGQSTNRIDPINDIIIPAATAAAFEVAPVATLGGIAGSTAGTAAGHDIGGTQGAEIGGIAGGIVGGAAGGAASGSAVGATEGSSTGLPGNLESITNQLPQVSGATAGAAGGAVAGAGEAAFPGNLESMTNQLPQIGGDSAVGGATGGGVRLPSPGGGVGPGSSLGTDPSTNQKLGGGGTGDATTPGADALGTGANAQQPPIGGGPTASQIAQGANDLATGAKLATSINSLVNPPTPQAGTSVPQVPTEQAPIGGGVPISQIAAGVPSGTFQSATDDFTRQQENTIRAQFANSNISGTPQEQRAIQQADREASQRASMVQQAMNSAGISDQQIYMQILNSGLQTPAQIQNAITQMRARGLV